MIPAKIPTMRNESSSTTAMPRDVEPCVRLAPVNEWSARPEAPSAKGGMAMRRRIPLQVFSPPLPSCCCCGGFCCFILTTSLPLPMTMGRRRPRAEQGAGKGAGSGRGLAKAVRHTTLVGRRARATKFKMEKLALDIGLLQSRPPLQPVMRLVKTTWRERQRERGV